MTDGEPDLESLLADLRATVAERRARGEYPPGLEDELDAHFRRVAEARPVRTSLEPLRAQVDGLLAASRFSADRISTDSSTAGGAALHRSLARVFARQAEGILQQVQEFADRTRETLATVTDLLTDANTHVHEDLAGVVDAHTEVLAGRERFPADPTLRLDELTRRVEQLEQSASSTPPGPSWDSWISRARFDAAFANEEDRTVEEAVAEVLEESESVLVVSPPSLAGRLGEQARLLAPDADLPAELDKLADGELDRVVCLRADAHIGPAEMLELVGRSATKLRPGGRLIVSWREAEDGESPVRYDPTLPPPLPAAYLAFACREAGFGDVELESRTGATKLLVATR